MILKYSGLGLKLENCNFAFEQGRFYELPEVLYSMVKSQYPAVFRINAELKAEAGKSLVLNIERDAKTKRFTIIGNEPVKTTEETKPEKPETEAAKRGRGRPKKEEL